LQVLKAGDQEAYLRMVEESKNERLTMLLDKTNELLEGIGKAVQRQKDAEHVSRPEVSKDSESDESPEDSPSDDDEDTNVSANNSKFNAGRRLDSTVHSIEEKVDQSFTFSHMDFTNLLLEKLGLLGSTFLIVFHIRQLVSWRLEARRLKLDGTPSLYMWRIRLTI
jgi:hypothetical protein